MLANGPIKVHQVDTFDIFVNHFFWGVHFVRVRSVRKHTSFLFVVYLNQFNAGL